MEKRVNKKIEQYITAFKDEIRNKINDINFTEKDKTNELIEFVYEYQRLNISKDDLNKRKRIKNSIPSLDRCNARRANNEQCTRRRKEGFEFCGTHSKGTPNGLIQNMNECNDCISQKHEVFAEDIHGIVYYIDKYENVYKTEDIMSGIQNPKIIAKCVKTERGYDIPEFGLV